MGNVRWIPLLLKSLLKIPAGVGGVNLDSQTLLSHLKELTCAIENDTIFRNSPKPPTQNVMA